MVYRDNEDGSRSPSPAASGPGPNGAFPAFRDPAVNPYSGVTYGSVDPQVAYDNAYKQAIAEGHSSDYATAVASQARDAAKSGVAGTTVGRWKYLEAAATPAWYVVPDNYDNWFAAGAAPAGYVWYQTEVGGGKRYLTLYARDAAGGDPIGYDPGTNPEFKGSFGPLLTVPQDGRVVLTGGTWQINLDATIDKWHGGGQTLLTVPKGGTITLTNPMHSFQVQGPVAGVLKQSRPVSVTLTYRQLEGDLGGPYGPESFNASMREQWANRSGFGVEASGEFGIDTSNPKAWFMSWPTVTGAGTILGGGLEVLANIAAWLVKWGPWILLAIGVILALWLLPHLVLLIAKAIVAWKAAYLALMAAL